MNCRALLAEQFSLYSGQLLVWKTWKCREEVSRRGRTVHRMRLCDMRLHAADVGLVYTVDCMLRAALYRLFCCLDMKSSSTFLQNVS